MKKSNHFVKTNFVELSEKLNKEIISETTKALSLIKGKCIEWDGKTPLCRVIASVNGEYDPKNLKVTHVWLNADNVLCFSAIDDDGEESSAWDENDELHDITDFQYLIEQIVDLM